MKVLVLGGSGMLGHKIWQRFAPQFETYVTLRKDPSIYGRLGLFDETRVLSGLAAENVDAFGEVLDRIRPNVVINCIGIVKQDPAANDAVASITINSLFPHRLARSCRIVGARLIHLSTDCVFSGAKGKYAETDAPDAGDLYGRSKLLGEVRGEGCLTIRTSMIGRELEGSHGLLEWFLSQQGGRVPGYRKAVFSGFTTLALADLLAKVISDYPELNGLRHVAADPINKYDLLSLIKESYQLEIEIEPNETFVCDRSLDGSHFRAETGIVAPPWPEMIESMRNDPTNYNEWRRANAAR
jgi:dTDP-4-dehydrorhamnose reductase